MNLSSTDNILEQPLWPVKSDEAITFGTPPDPMIHHKSYYSKRGKSIVYKSKDREKRYGVSYSRRLLSPGLLLRKYDSVRYCLENIVKQTPAEREVTLRLLRLWAYYDNVYPKESQVTEIPGCSKATFWRTVRALKDLGLIDVINRFVIRPHAQISNIYRLDKLVILIARYLAKHITQFWPPYFIPDFNMTWAEFEKFIEGGQLKLPYSSSGSPIFRTTG